MVIRYNSLLPNVTRPNTGLSTISLSESYYNLANMYLCEMTNKLQQVKQGYYISLLEAGDDIVLLNEASNGLFEKIKSIIDKFIEFIKKIFGKFITAMNKLVKSDKFLTKHKGMFKYFDGSTDTFSMNVYTYTHLKDDTIPNNNTITVWGKDTGYGAGDSTLGNTAEDIIQMISDRYDILKASVSENGMDDFRGKVLGDLKGSINSKDYGDELFKIFRNGESQKSKKDITSLEVNEALSDFEKYDDRMKAVKTLKTNIEKSYSDIKSDIKTISGGRGSNGYWKVIYGDAIDITKYETLSAENKKIVDQKGIEFVNLLISEIEQRSIAHAKAFASKLEAIKECYSQDKKILYAVLSRIEKHHVLESADEIGPENVPQSIDTIGDDEEEGHDPNHPYEDGHLHHHHNHVHDGDAEYDGNHHHAHYDSKDDEHLENHDDIYDPDHDYNHDYADGSEHHHHDHIHDEYRNDDDDDDDDDEYHDHHGHHDHHDHHGHHGHHDHHDHDDDDDDDDDRESTDNSDIVYDTLNDSIREFSDMTLIANQISSQDSIYRYLLEADLIDAGEFRHLRAINEGVIDTIKNVIRKIVEKISGMFKKFNESVSSLVMSRQNYLKKYKYIFDNPSKYPVKSRDIEIYPYDTAAIAKGFVIPEWDYPNGPKFNSYMEKASAEGANKVKAFIDAYYSTEIGSKFDEDKSLEQIVSDILRGAENEESIDAQKLDWKKMYNIVYNSKDNVDSITKNANTITNNSAALERALDSLEKSIPKEEKAAEKEEDKKEPNTQDNGGNSTDKDESPKAEAQNDSFVYSSLYGTVISEMKVGGKGGDDAGKGMVKSVGNQGINNQTKASIQGSLNGNAEEKLAELDKIKENAKDFFTMCGNIMAAKLAVTHTMLKEYYKLLTIHVSDYVATAKKTEDEK